MYVVVVVDVFIAVYNIGHEGRSGAPGVIKAVAMLQHPLESHTQAMRPYTEPSMGMLLTRGHPWAWPTAQH